MLKIALSLLFLVAVTATIAQARNCTTTCTPNYGGGQTCNTYCW